MEGAGHFPHPFEFVFKLYETYLCQFVEKLFHSFAYFELFGIKVFGFFLQLYVRGNLLQDVGCAEGESRSEDTVEGFQKVKPVYPFGKPVKFGFQFHAALVAGEVVVAVSAFEIEADSPVVLPVLLIVVFNRIIHLLCLPVHAVRADESSTAEDVEDFFG